MTTAPFPSQTGSAPETPSEEPIRWPEQHQPGRAAVFAHNELEIPAPVEVVWRVLLCAGEWPEWYPNASHIHFLSHAGPCLRNRSRFRWTTFGVRITSKVLEFEPERRLAWDAHGIGIEAWHAWLLTPLANGGTGVVTEETQNGWLAKLGRTLRPGRLGRMHDVWLRQLSLRAQAFSG